MTTPARPSVAWRRTRWSRRATAAAAGLALVRGRLLADEPDPWWAAPESAVAEQWLRRLRHALLGASARSGDFMETEHQARALLGPDPFDEVARAGAHDGPRPHRARRLRAVRLRPLPHAAGRRARRQPRGGHRRPARRDPPRRAHDGHRTRRTMPGPTPGCGPTSRAGPPPSSSSMRCLEESCAGPLHPLRRRRERPASARPGSCGPGPRGSGGPPVSVASVDLRRVGPGPPPPARARPRRRAGATPGRRRAADDRPRARRGPCSARSSARPHRERDAVTARRADASPARARASSTAR